MTQMIRVGVDLSSVNSGVWASDGVGGFYAAAIKKKPQSDVRNPLDRWLEYVDDLIDAVRVAQVRLGKGGGGTPGSATPLGVLIAVEENPFGLSTSGAFAGEIVGAFKAAVVTQLHPAVFVGINNSRWKSYYGVGGRYAGEKAKRLAYAEAAEKHLGFTPSCVPGIKFSAQGWRDVVCSALIGSFAWEAFRVRCGYPAPPSSVIGVRPRATLISMSEDESSWWREPASNWLLK